MKRALLYLFLIAFLLSPAIWPVGAVAIPFMAVTYFVVIYLVFNARFLPLIIKLINALVIVAALSLCTAMTIFSLSCPAGTCDNAGLASISTFVISLPVVLVLALLDGWLYRASLATQSGMDVYRSLMYLSEKENWN